MKNLDLLLSSEMKEITGGSLEAPTCHCTSGAAAVVVRPVVIKKGDPGFRPT